MPNALTHFYIYEKAIEKVFSENWGDDRLLKVFPEMMKVGMASADKGGDRPSLKFILKKLATSQRELGPALKRSLKGKREYHATLASYGYLGSNGPDMFFVPPTILKGGLRAKPKLGLVPVKIYTEEMATNTLSTLMHHNTVGAPVIYGLILLKEQMSKKLTREEKILWLCKLAYWLGHITHIAADITVHPFVNSRAGANKLLEKGKFKNFQGSAPKAVWTLHNIVEQLQDRYVLSKALYKNQCSYGGGKESFRAMAFGSLAALHLREKPEHRFIGKTIDDFYGQDYAGQQSYTKGGCKYEYCRAWYWLDSKVRSHMSFRNYLKNVVPSEKQYPHDAEAKDRLVGERDFDEHITAAIDLSVKMLREALRFLRGGTKAQGGTPRAQVYSVREEFELLNANFNIDAGLFFKFHGCDKAAKIGETKGITCRVPLRVELKTYENRDKAIPNWKYNKASGDAAVGRASSGRRRVVKQFYNYWGADVVTTGNETRSGFGVYAASRSDHDQDTVGSKIRTKTDGYSLLRKTDVKSLWVDYGDREGVSVLAPVRGTATTSAWKRFWQRRKRDYPEINLLCDKMIVPTVGARQVWRCSGSGRFDGEMISRSDRRLPTEQLFLKFHFFKKKEDDGSFECWPEGEGGAIRLPFEPGINNIAVVVGDKNELKEVFLDQQKVWEAEKD